jgi:hypothetical protein
MWSEADKKTKRDISTKSKSMAFLHSLLNQKSLQKGTFKGSNVLLFFSFKTLKNLGWPN